ncbi:MAG TPA: hypothetical protein VNZ55_05640 [Thermomicrobiales bacterium]|nr:hypothetical protein [Thermomicrobiales bacterium]
MHSFYTDRMNDQRHQRQVQHRDFEQSTMKSALGTALVVTLVALMAVKLMTGITGFGAFGIALLAFCLSFGFALRTSRGIHR